MGVTVGLMFNLGKYDLPGEGEPSDANAELDSEQTVMAVATALRSAGHHVVLIEGDEAAYGKLQQVRPEIVFNMCEGLRGASRESHVPALLEMLGIPYTGSELMSLAVSLDKATAKKLFHYHGVPTPAFRTVHPGQSPDWSELRFPLFVKPACEGSSKGITHLSKVDTPAELIERVRQIHARYQQPALVEEFIAGREFTVGIVGNADPMILPIMEINFQPVPPEHGHVYSYQFKQEWDADEYYLCPAPVDPLLEALLKQTALAAFRALDCADVARVDVRLDNHGMPYVLEVNPLPGLSPGFSDLCRQAAAAGWAYAELVNGILNAALSRYRARSAGRAPLAEPAERIG